MCIDKETGKVNLKFKEMITSGCTGTMSATGFMGILSGMLALLAICALVIYYFCVPGEATNILELLDRVIVIFSISAGLLGVRKISGVIGSKQFSAETRDNTQTRQYGSGTDNTSDVLNE